MSDKFYQLGNDYVLALEEHTAFPQLSQALIEPNGLIAIGGRLSQDRLLNAYKNGIFPWYSENEPVMWWSPDPRMVLFPEALKITSSLKKTIKKQLFDLRLNTAFESVIRACGQVPRAGQDGTWITQEIIQAYSKLHHNGHAISSESWLNGDLVGGCYGVIIGNMFYGESMFYTQTDASKVAFVHLVEHLKDRGVGMIDCQMKTPLLNSFGAGEISRDTFMQTLTKLIH